MASVTQRIKEIKQPYGGYLKLSDFEIEEIEDNENLSEENIHSSLVGLAVDYLTRVMLGTPVEDAFKISLAGAKIINEETKAYNLLRNIKRLDNISIFNACKLVGYDVCFRKGSIGYKNVDNIEADNHTINNIKIMVKRSVTFFKKYGPIIKNGFTFEGGYTSFINSGDGDFLTEDTMWDLKVSSRTPTSAHTLQLLIYYIMGIHSIHGEFNNIQKLGIFNPRKNCIYTKNITDIPANVIDKVSLEVIGYGNYSEINKKDISTDLNNNMLTMSEIMKTLSCTRYMVMKYYSENDLPLVKANNKYYISREDLTEWLEKMEKEAKVQQMIYIIVSILSIVVVLFWILHFYNTNYRLFINL